MEFTEVVKKIEETLYIVLGKELQDILLSETSSEQYMEYADITLKSKGSDDIYLYLLVCT